MTAEEEAWLMRALAHSFASARIWQQRANTNAAARWMAESVLDHHFALLERYLELQGRKIDVQR